MKQNKKNVVKNIAMKAQEKPNLFKDAQIYKANINFTGNYATIKLPKNQLIKYLGLDKNTKTLNVIPMNGSVQMVRDIALTCIPAMDLGRVEEFFKANTI